MLWITTAIGVGLGILAVVLILTHPEDCQHPIIIPGRVTVTACQ
jgi:hypothetical protein